MAVGSTSMATAAAALIAAEDATEAEGPVATAEEGDVLKTNISESAKEATAEEDGEFGSYGDVLGVLDTW